MKNNTKKNILFVCMGNICRSPAAEGVMQKLIEDEGLEDKISVDSAGTIGYHVGETADARMVSSAKNRGYELLSIARKFDPETDFDEFDYIVTMDNDNYYKIRAMDRNLEHDEKIYKMIEFSQNLTPSEVPDPYYGGENGFEDVLDILVDACAGLLEKVKSEIE